jgi:hypothetical protein
VAVLAPIANLIVQRLDAHDKLVQQQQSADDALAHQRESASDALAQQRESAQAAFQLKSAEIVMDATGPFQARGRSVALRELFPERLGAEFATTFNPEHATNRKTFERDQIVASKKELLKMISEHPEARTAIVGAWRALFPDDEWAAALRP